MSSGVSGALGSKVTGLTPLHAPAFDTEHMERWWSVTGGKTVRAEVMRHPGGEEGWGAPVHRRDDKAILEAGIVQTTNEQRVTRPFTAFTSPTTLQIP